MLSAETMIDTWAERAVWTVLLRINNEWWATIVFSSRDSIIRVTDYAL
jgi:hypothetical protein